MDKIFPPAELPQISAFASAREADLCLQQHTEAVCCKRSGGKQRSPKEIFGNHRAAAHSLALAGCSHCQLIAKPGGLRSRLPTAAERSCRGRDQSQKAPSPRASPGARHPALSTSEDAAPRLPSPRTSSIPLPPAPSSERHSTNPLGRDEGKAGKSLLVGTRCR